MGRTSTRRCTRTLAASVTLLLSIAATAFTQSPERAAAVSRITIGNFGKVDANYYRGEQPKENDYAALAALGIRTVIALKPAEDKDRESQLVEAAGMTFHRIPMSSRVVPTAEQIAEFMAIVTDPRRLPVFVHCAGGKHRTGVMTAVYRMEHDGWTADEAYQEMKRYKFGSSLWHPEFKAFVYRYQPVQRSTGGPSSR